MQNKTFEDIILNDKDLNMLLNTKEIAGLSDFSRLSINSEFKEYIKETYYQSFKSIFKTYSDSNFNEAKINSLLRSVDYLATDEVKDSIALHISPILDTSIESLENVKKLVLSNHPKIETQGLVLDDALSSIVINICNKFDSNTDIMTKKKKIIELCLDICDDVSKVNPKKEPFKYAINNMIINNLEKINNFDSLEARFKIATSKISNKRTGIEIKYWLFVAVIVILLISKFLSKMN